jgi:MoaA/NifB/PqqE/SkfB family radical SAM enzyme
MGFYRLDQDTIIRYEPKLMAYLVIHKNKLLYLYDKEIIDELHAIVGFNSKKQLNHYLTPLNVQIQVTRGCNFSCSFCYANSVNVNNPDVYMSYDRLKILIDILFDWGVPNIQYVGGEAFVHPNFKQLIEYTRSKGLAQTLITNGIIPGLKINEYRDILTAFSKIQV